jgi:hypothetical protein
MCNSSILVKGDEKMKKLIIIMTLLLSIGLVGCGEESKTEAQQAMEKYNQDLLNQNDNRKDAKSTYVSDEHIDKISINRTDNEKYVTDIKIQLLNWIKNHKDKTILSIAYPYENNNTSNMYIIYQDKIPNGDAIVDIYNVRTDHTNETYNYMNQISQNNKRILAICSGYASDGYYPFIIISSNN